MTNRRALGSLLALVVVFTNVPGAWAHGDEEMPVSEEAQIQILAEQPARVLAQQALGLIEVRGDAHEAAVRLDAALESSDQRDIDRRLLMQATDTLDGGDPTAAAVLLDQALSRPFGADSGKALHESGREFRPAAGPQEVVAIAVGILLLLAGGMLLRGRPKPATSD